ncbi:MAG TPA: hypothetical protein VFW03_20975 [Gemmatimonadaceae bacterium]|nr:hypothetical protein [Gemmatimonadaceae bacterium]
MTAWTSGGTTGRVAFRFTVMGFLQDAFRNAVLFGQEALTGGNVWILMLILIFAIGVVAALRGKLTESWIWIPMLALAMWYAVYRWLELRA